MGRRSGMQCKHIHTKGLRKGEQCRSNFACADPAEPGYGYCFRHQVERKLVPKEKLEEFNNKRIAGIVRAQKKRGTPEGGRKSEIRKAKVEVEADEKREVEEKERVREMQGKVRELLHKILGDLDFDAEELVRDLGDGVKNFAITKDIQKFIFIGWHVADVETRKPATLRGLCLALGMKMAEGMDWINSDWFVNDLTTSMTRMMKLAMPYLQRKNLENALQNDFKAFQEYTRFFGKKTAESGEKDWTEEMDPVIEEMVEGVAEEAN